MTTRHRVIVTFVAAVLLAGPLIRSVAELEPSGVPLGDLSVLTSCEFKAGAVEWQPVALGADVVRHQRYLCRGLEIAVDVAQYLEQERGKEAANELNLVVAKEQLPVTERSRIDLGDGLEVVEHRVTLDVDAAFIVWSWYAVDGVPAATQLGAKTLEVLDALRMRSPEVVRFAVATRQAPDIDPMGLLEATTEEVWRWYLDDRRAARQLASAEAL